MFQLKFQWYELEIRFVLDFFPQILVHNQLIRIFVPQSEIGGGLRNFEINAELSDDVIDGECRVNSSADSHALFSGNIIGGDKSC